MNSSLRYAMLGLAAALFAGCGGDDETPAGGNGDGEHAEAHDDEHGHGHDHAHGHVLTWPREDLEHEGYTISLGYHGTEVYAEHELEPAVSVTLDGEPIENAHVFVALVSADGQDVLAEEVEMVYEAPTDEEPAHYAQGMLEVPAGVDRAAIRYRVVLPGDAPEFTQDVPVAVEEHE